MNNETCPHCNGEVMPNKSSFDCGTIVSTLTTTDHPKEVAVFHRSPLCQEREARQKAECELSELRLSAANWSECLGIANRRAEKAEAELAEVKAQLIASQATNVKLRNLLERSTDMMLSDYKTFPWAKELKKDYDLV